MRRLLSALVLVLVAAAFAGPAAADSRTANDPRRDTRGSYYPGKPYVWSKEHGCWVTEAAPECGENDYFEDQAPLLDIVSVRHGHKGAQVVHRVTMARTWQGSLLSADRRGQISLYFNVDRDAAFERRVDLFVRRGKVAAAMRAGRRTVATPTVTRPSGKTVEIRFARTALGRRPLTYKWLAFAGIACKREYDRCGDRSPNATVLSHRLR